MSDDQDALMKELCEAISSLEMQEPSMVRVHREQRGRAARIRAAIIALEERLASQLAAAREENEKLRSRIVELETPFEPHYGPEVGGR